MVLLLVQIGGDGQFCQKIHHLQNENKTPFFFLVKLGSKHFPLPVVATY